MKKIISVLLAVLMLAGCMAISFCALAVETVSITIKTPKVGETPATTATITPEKYSKYMETLSYGCSDTGGKPKYEVDGAYKAGYTYWVIIPFTIDNQDDFETFDAANITINGKEVTKTAVGTNSIKLTCRLGTLEAPETVSITVKDPKVGETPATTATITPEKYSKYMGTLSYGCSDTGGKPKYEVDGAYKAGYTYWVIIPFTIDNQDDFETFDAANITINGKEVTKTAVGTNSIKLTCRLGTLEAPADPEPQPQPENLCKWCGKVHEGFFQKIIGFFHRILAAIFGAKY